MIPTRATSGTTSNRTWLRGLKEQLLSQNRQPCRRHFCSHESEFLETREVISANAIAGIVRTPERTGTFHQQIAFNDDGGGPGESRSRKSYLEYPFATGGAYYMGVSGYDNNSYDPGRGTGDVSGSTASYDLIRPISTKSFLV